MAEHTRELTGESGENTSFIALISCVATIGGFLCGFDSGVINGTVEGLQAAFDSDSAATIFNVASMLLGCAVGAFFSGQLADRFGRRSLLMVAAVLFLISAWGSGIASSSVEFIFFRILGGLAVGAASILSPAYLSELTPARFQGAIIVVQKVAIICGLFVAFVSNYLLAKSAGSSISHFWWDHEAWRWMFWAEIVPASLFFFALMLIPESPRYLVVTAQKERAKQVLSNLFGSVLADLKVAQIIASIEEDHRPKLSDLVDQHSERIRRLVWMVIGLACFQQLVGFNVVFYYGAVFWQYVGFTESDALLINIISGGLSIFGCVMTMWLIDHIGQKPLLLTGSIFMALMLGVVALTFAGAHTHLDDGLVLDSKSGAIEFFAANAYVCFLISRGAR